jgi:hypothetical protein
VEIKISNQAHNIYQKKNQFTKRMKSSRLGIEEELEHLKIYHLHQEVLVQADISQKPVPIHQIYRTSQDGLFPKLDEPQLREQKLTVTRPTIPTAQSEDRQNLRKRQLQPATLVPQTEVTATN